jgi:AcrR family transcriptional regulator
MAATGVDDVAEASGLTKPTLYRYFPSKDALVAAYLDGRHEQLDVELRRWLAGSPPGNRPRAVIDWLCDSISRTGFNGCAFTRACAELNDDRAVREKARKRKRVLLETIQDACRAAGDLAAALVGARELAQLALAGAGLEES